MISNMMTPRKIISRICGVNGSAYARYLGGDGFNSQPEP